LKHNDAKNQEDEIETEEQVELKDINYGYDEKYDEKATQIGSY
jgi:hypothetical protein